MFAWRDQGTTTEHWMIGLGHLAGDGANFLLGASWGACSDIGVEHAATLSAADTELLGYVLRVDCSFRAKIGWACMVAIVAPAPAALVSSISMERV